MTDSCPPAEDLGALVDGEVSGASRERLLAHLNACEECFETFTVAVEFLEANPQFARARPRKRRYAVIAIAAAAAALVAALFLRGCPGEEGPELASSSPTSIKEEPDSRAALQSPWPRRIALHGELAPRG